MKDLTPTKKIRDIINEAVEKLELVRDQLIYDVEAEAGNQGYDQGYEEGVESMS